MESHVIEMQPHSNLHGNEDGMSSLLILWSESDRLEIWLKAAMVDEAANAFILCGIDTAKKTVIMFHG